HLDGVAALGELDAGEERLLVGVRRHAADGGGAADLVVDLELDREHAGILVAHVGDLDAHAVLADSAAGLTIWLLDLQRGDLQVDAGRLGRRRISALGAGHLDADGPGLVIELQLLDLEVRVDDRLQGVGAGGQVHGGESRLHVRVWPHPEAGHGLARPAVHVEQDVEAPDPAVALVPDRGARADAARDPTAAA